MGFGKFIIDVAKNFLKSDGGQQLKRDATEYAVKKTWEGTQKGYEKLQKKRRGY